jgi:hypothetical protein
VYLRLLALCSGEDKFSPKSGDLVRKGA